MTFFGILIPLMWHGLVSLSLPECWTALLSFFPFYLQEISIYKARENQTDSRIVLQMLCWNVEDELAELVLCAVFTSFGNKQGVQKEKSSFLNIGPFYWLLNPPLNLLTFLQVCEVTAQAVADHWLLWLCHSNQYYKVLLHLFLSLSFQFSSAGMKCFVH